MLFTLVIYDKGELKSKITDIAFDDIFKSIPPYVTILEGWSIQKTIVPLSEHEYYRLAHNSRTMMNVYVVRQPEPEPGIVDMDSIAIPIPSDTLTRRTQQPYIPLPESDDEDIIVSNPNEIVSCFDRICKKIRRLLIRITAVELTTTPEH